MAELVPDWKQIFDNIRVPWVDQGRNVARGEINIKCPWCGNTDPSEHLGISLNNLVYGCKRNKSHKGGHRGGAIRLLRELGISYSGAVLLLDNYSTTEVATLAGPKGITQTAVTKQWDRFSPAIEFGKLRAYLATRGFPDPEVVCQRYDLRFAPHGEWVGRVLLPITEHGSVIAWVGRAIYPHITPKYKMQQVQDTGLVYAPRRTNNISIIVEGPMDALKINAACEDMPISAAALTGLAVSDWSAPHPERLLRIRNFLQGAEIRLVALDASVDIAQVDRLLKTIAEWQGIDYYVYRLPILPGFDDPGEMDYDSIRYWITNFCTRLGSSTDATEGTKHTESRAT